MVDSNAGLPVSMISYGPSMIRSMMRFSRSPIVYYSIICLQETGEDPVPSIQDKIVRMIAILHSDTYPNMVSWPGYSCIPRRVFGPREYLVDPPIQPTRPRVTSKPVPAAGGGSRLAQDQPRSEFGTFSHPEPQATCVHPGPGTLKVPRSVSSCRGSKLYLLISMRK